MGRVNCSVSMVLALKNREHIACGMITGFLLTQWLHSPSHGSSLWQKCCLDLSSGTLIARVCCGTMHSNVLGAFSCQAVPYGSSCHTALLPFWGCCGAVVPTFA